MTNSEFKRFLDTTHYAPKDAINFLRDWRDGNYPEGWSNRPVSWVSFENAHLCGLGRQTPAARVGMAVGRTGNRRPQLPWGNQWVAANVPVPESSHQMRGPDAVDAHPTGASPYGVLDMAEEFTDEHTRGGIVRGGEYYQPQGSKWYFPEAFHND